MACNYFQYIFGIDADVVVCPEPNISRMGQEMLERTMSILNECKEIWPLASRWLDALVKSSCDPKVSSIGLEGSMADGVCIYYVLVASAQAFTL